MIVPGLVDMYGDPKTRREQARLMRAAVVKLACRTFFPHSKSVFSGLKVMSKVANTELVKAIRSE